jgi:hypothetical protein
MSSSQTKRPPLKSADLEDLKQKQLDATSYEDGQGEIDHLSGNTPDGEKYKFPAHEAGLMHVELALFQRKPGSREFDRKAKVVKLSPQEFERMEKNDSFAEYQGEDGEVVIFHDCRSKARQQQDATGDVRTGSPAEPSKPLATLNDAQMRYHELTKELAPTDLTLGQLIDKIAELEAAKGAQKTTPDAEGEQTKKPLRTKADYQARYKELSGGEEAPTDKTIDELKEAITHFESQGSQQ